jgi:hypothetical protein
VVQHLPSKCEVLVSNQRTTKQTTKPPKDTGMYHAAGPIRHSERVKKTGGRKELRVLTLKRDTEGKSLSCSYGHLGIL